MLCSLSMRAIIIGAGGGDDGIISPKGRGKNKGWYGEEEIFLRAQIGEPVKGRDFGIEGGCEARFQGSCKRTQEKNSSSNWICIN